MNRNFQDITTLHVKDVVYGPSTSTTSFTFVTSVSSITTSATAVLFTKQTMYMKRGVLVNLSTVTSTSAPVA